MLNGPGFGGAAGNICSNVYAFSPDEQLVSCCGFSLCESDDVVGLAKSSASQKPGPEDATLVAGLTTEGTILGTPQCMASEQFEGKEADARADIWAFGAVMYEMVTGQKAFQGKNYSSLVVSILAAEPPAV